MKKHFFFAALAGFLFLFFSCGKKGPLQPPLVRIPQAVKDAALFQRGESLFLEWSNPLTRIDGSPLADIIEIEIWLVEEDIGKEDQEVLKSREKDRRLLLSIKKEELPGYRKKDAGDSLRYEYSHRLGRKEFGLKRLSFSIRVRESGKRWSDFSDWLSIEPRALPRPPQSIQATVHEDRVEIRWKPPVENIDGSAPAVPAGYNVYRSEEEESPVRLNPSLVKSPAFDDRGFSFGKTYRYLVRASATESEPFQESDDSEIKEVVTEDIFPPAPPSGLVAISGPGFITLSWEPNTEKDFEGYRAWRREEGEKDFTLLTPESFPQNNFRDSRVEKKKLYHYAITALDQSGNESPRSEVVSAAVGDEKP